MPRKPRRQGGAVVVPKNGQACLTVTITGPILASVTFHEGLSPRCYYPGAARPRFHFRVSTPPCSGLRYFSAGFTKPCALPPQWKRALLTAFGRWRRLLRWRILLLRIHNNRSLLLGRCLRRHCPIEHECQDGNDDRRGSCDHASGPHDDAGFRLRHVTLGRQCRQHSLDLCFEFGKAMFHFVILALPYHASFVVPSLLIRKS